MACFGKHLIRGGVISAIVLGAGLAIAGPHRVGALFTQARGVVNDQIDAAITDPVALRAQLRDLEAQYPKRIGDVRSDLSQLKDQKAQLERDLAVSNRVVALADADLEKLASALGQAEAATVQQASYGEGVEHRIVIVFKNERIDVPAAQVKSNQITATRNAYAQRAADITRDLGYLGQQERQLTQLLTKLEGEQTAFQTQLFDLDRQIDAIGRNERMITIMQDRQATLDEQSRYRAASLDQITGKLSDLRAKQEAQLAALAAGQDRFSYEDAAKADLDREGGAKAAGRSAEPISPARALPTVIEINPDRPAAPATEGGPVARAGD